MALTDKLSAIGTAIREKTGGSELLTLDAMPEAIRGISGGGGGEVEPVELTGNLQYGCAGPLSGKYIDLHGNTITTKDIIDATSFFFKSTAKEIPFTINFKQGAASHPIDNMFSSCMSLETLPRMINVKPSGLKSLFEGCRSLREIPDDYFDDWDWSYLTGLKSTYSGTMTYVFSNCKSLRKLPPLRVFSNGNPNIVNSNAFYYGLFNQCNALDEVVDLPFPHYDSTWTGNAFYNTFHACCRLKKITFALQEDGSPYVMKWKSQIIDLSNPNNMYPVGYASYSSSIIGDNSGITADKEVKDDATYQALKDDPDWFTLDINYCRYNHDSAVATINTLPDTSAYLAANGGTNTIKFRGQSGTLTDGGAINTLTEEEIAVAAAKGWTVSLS
jgi:hypothetical protein